MKNVFIFFLALSVFAINSITVKGADKSLQTNSPAPSADKQSVSTEKALEFKSYKEALEEVTQSRSPLLVVISATWCGPCKRLKNVILPDLAKRGELDGITVAAVDYQVDKELIKSMTKETKIPQMVLYTPTGDNWKPSRMTGLQPTDKIIHFLAEGKARMAADNLQPEQKTAAMFQLTPPTIEAIETESVFTQSPFQPE